MNMILEPDLLQTFVAIADSGSFNQAAKRVYRTQSAVSMQMKRLEEVIGRPLFGRQGRSMNLTADGELLLGMPGGFCAPISRRWRHSTKPHWKAALFWARRTITAALFYPAFWRGSPRPTRGCM